MVAIYELYEIITVKLKLVLLAPIKRHLSNGLVIHL
jgi:hypothetical protein